MQHKTNTLTLISNITFKLQCYADTNKRTRLDNDGISFDANGIDTDDYSGGGPVRNGLSMGSNVASSQPLFFRGECKLNMVN